MVGGLCGPCSIFHFIFVFIKPWLNKSCCMNRVLSSWKSPSSAGNKVCNIRWTLSAKTSLRYCPVILYFRVTIGLVENYATRLSVLLQIHLQGRRQSRSYACVGVLQTCTRPVVGKSVKDGSSDNITIFHLSKQQVLWLLHHYRRHLALTSVTSGLGIAALP